MYRPLLLIDIDGVISLFGFDHSKPPAGQFVSVDGITYFLSSEAAARVVDLGREFELTWCSGWEDKADEHLPFALGVPAGIPHLSFADPFDCVERHWKLAAIDEYAGPTRALAWIDDGHDDRCAAWARARPGPTLLVSTDPAVGLTDAQAAELRAWALELGNGQLKLP